MNRVELERIRDSFKPGQKVRVIKNSWCRPNTIGKVGTIVLERDQFTPTVRVKFEKFSHTFSPDDVEPIK